MKRILLITAAVAMALILSACSREGFKESLERGKSPSNDGSQMQQPEPQFEDEDFIFNLSSDEYEQDNCIYYYALPKPTCEQAETAANKIAKELKEIIDSLPEQVAAGREFEMIAVYDAITQNNGKIFSVMYEIEVSLSDETEEIYALGLVFDPTTGERIELDELKDIDTFVTLILDEQLSKMPGKKEDVKAQKREYLSEQGDKKLKNRLTETEGLEELLDASYYVDGDELVALFAADQQLGGVIEVSVDI